MIIAVSPSVWQSFHLVSDLVCFESFHSKGPTLEICRARETNEWRSSSSSSRGAKSTQSLLVGRKNTLFFFLQKWWFRKTFFLFLSLSLEGSSKISAQIPLSVIDLIEEEKNECFWKQTHIAFEHISLHLLQLAEVNTQERICKS